MKVPNPNISAPAEAFARLTPEGALDPGFGEDGILVIEFPGTAVEEPYNAFPSFLNSRRQHFILEDGSLVALVGVVDEPEPPLQFRLGLYGLTPDGSYDTRIAPAGSTHGAGRTIFQLDVARPGDWASTYESAATLDRDDRIVFAVTFLNQQSFGDTTVPVDLAFGRIVISEDGGGGGGGNGGGGGGGGGGETAPQFAFDGGRLVVNGGSGADRIAVRLAEGTVRVFWGAGFDTLLTEQNAAAVQFVEVHGFGGADDLRNEVGESFGGFVTLLGGAGNDSLTGDGRYDRLFGDDGDDSIVGGNGPQLLRGGRGNDTLLGGGGRDALFGAEGDDSLVGGHGSDFLDGGEGNDILRGESGADTLAGGFGTDVLDGGTDNPEDTDDRRERDLASYAAFSQQVAVDLAAGTATHPGLPLNPGEAPPAEADQLIAIEDVLGGSGGDLLVGDDGRNRLFGGGGNDTLRGLAGKDTLFAGAGDDLLEGGDDTDWLFGPLATSSAGRARLVGGGGFDWGISGDDEEREGLERWFTSVDGFINSIA